MWYFPTFYPILDCQTATGQPTLGNTEPNHFKPRFTSKLLWKTTLLSDENWRKLVSPHWMLNIGGLRPCYCPFAFSFRLKYSESGLGRQYEVGTTYIRFRQQTLAGNYSLEWRKLTKTVITKVYCLFFVICGCVTANWPLHLVGRLTSGSRVFVDFSQLCR